MAMFKNNLKIAVRDIVQDKDFSFINGLGLAVAMLSALLWGYLSWKLNANIWA